MINKERYSNKDYIELDLSGEEEEHCNKEEVALLKNSNDSEDDFIIYEIDETTEKEPISQKQHSLAIQAFPSLIISIIGLVFAGDLMDEFQYWDVFIKTSEFFILLPILLNLKGNLEMNLAARFSTSSNLGELDYGPTRRSLIIGNLALLQVQSIVAGAIAGFSSFALGLLTKPEVVTTYFEMMYVVASSILSAALSAGILGIFMCVLILICRRYNIDPDNIACPMASSIGDIVTLILLATFATILEYQMNTGLCTIIVVFMLLILPLFSLIVWRNEHVKGLLFTGWTPIVFAMVISSLAGILLESNVEQYKGVALLTPVLIGLAGNLGSIYASRVSTCLHSDSKENYRRVEFTLLAMNIPLQLVFMFIMWLFSMGQLTYNAWFFITYFLVSMLCTWICLKSSKFMTLMFWKFGYDPDNYVIPYLTSSIDVIGTVLLVCSFRALTTTGATNMALNT